MFTEDFPSTKVHDSNPVRKINLQLNRTQQNKHSSTFTLCQGVVNSSHYVVSFCHSNEYENRLKSFCGSESRDWVGCSGLDLSLVNLLIFVHCSCVHNHKSGLNFLHISTKEIIRYSRAPTTTTLHPLQIHKYIYIF